MVVMLVFLAIMMIFMLRVWSMVQPTVMPGVRCVVLVNDHRCQSAAPS